MKSAWVLIILVNFTSLLDYLLQLERKKLKAQIAQIFIFGVVFFALFFVFSFFFKCSTIFVKYSGIHRLCRNRIIKWKNIDLM